MHYIAFARLTKERRGTVQANNNNNISPGDTIYFFKNHFHWIHSTDIYQMPTVTQTDTVPGVLLSTE